MCFLEKRLHKIVPASIDLFVTPLVSVGVTGYLALTAIGPVFSQLETWVLDGVQWLIAVPFGIGAFLMGGLYSSTVVAGVHHMYTIIDLESAFRVQRDPLAAAGICGKYGTGCSLSGSGTQEPWQSENALSGVSGSTVLYDGHY